MNNELEELDIFLKSDENIRDIKPFEKMNSKYIDLQKAYTNMFYQIYKNVELQTKRKEFSKGGLGFHRGVYSPSSLDLVVNNLSRGRIINNDKSSSDFNYEYLFDSEDNLICVNTYMEINGTKKHAITEIILNENDIELGLTYDANNDNLISISECYYANGILIRYEYVICNMFYGGEGCEEINVEAPTFKNNLLESVAWSNYLPKMHLLCQYVYSFIRDDKGYIYKYTHKQISGYKSKSNVSNETSIYETQKRRK